MAADPHQHAGNGRAGLVNRNAGDKFTPAPDDLLITFLRLSISIYFGRVGSPGVIPHVGSFRKFKRIVAAWGIKLELGDVHCQLVFAAERSVSFDRIPESFGGYFVFGLHDVNMSLFRGPFQLDNHKVLLRIERGPV